MKTIYKYTLEVVSQQTIYLPEGAKILTVQAQHGKPCLWALIDRDAFITKARVIEIFGTSHNIFFDMGQSREYISTFQLSEGSFVGHVFEYTGV